MISNEIIEEIIMTSLKEKFLSKSQVFRFTKQIIETLESDTQEYFTRVSFGKNYWKDPEYATTNMRNGSINFNMETIYSSLNERRHIIDSYLTCNLDLLKIIVHEIQHLREPYKRKINKLDNMLLKYGSIKYMQKRYRTMYPNMTLGQFQRQYLKTYNNVPSERIAEIDSCKIILDSVLNYPNFKDNNNIEFQIVKQVYIVNNIGIYDKYKYPLKYYLKKIGRVDILNKCNDDYINNLQLEERLRAGFKVDEESIQTFEKIIRVK